MGPQGGPTSGGLTRDEVKRLYAQFAPVVFRRARVLLARDADAWDATAGRHTTGDGCGMVARHGAPR